MATIYLVIVFSPLAPLAMQSELIAHAVTGECSGDCRIDGCSLEQSAAHTCCCWQKKRHEIAESHRHSNGEVCNTAPAPPADLPKKRSSCCAAQARDTHETVSETKPAQKKMRTTTVSRPPCGSGKSFALASIESTHHMPFFFTGEIPSPEQRILTFTPPTRLTSRLSDPPDPPPIITITS